MERFNARLVVKGYSQQKGLDYLETFPLVVKMVTATAVIAFTTMPIWSLYQRDVYSALFARGEEEVYILFPPGLDSHNKGCRLLKSRYGLKQALRLWNLNSTNALISWSFSKSI